MQPLFSAQGGFSSAKIQTPSASCAHAPTPHVAYVHHKPILQDRLFRVNLAKAAASLALVFLVHEWFVMYDHVAQGLHHLPKPERMPAPAGGGVRAAGCVPTLHLIVRETSRAEPLLKRLTTLARANFDGACVALHVLVDRSARGVLDAATVAVAHSVLWPSGPKRVHTRARGRDAWDPPLDEALRCKDKPSASHALHALGSSCVHAVLKGLDTGVCRCKCDWCIVASQSPRSARAVDSPARGVQHANATGHSESAAVPVRR